VGLGVAVFMMTHSQKKLKKKNKRLTTKNRRLSLHAVSDADEYENNLTRFLEAANVEYEPLQVLLKEGLTAPFNTFLVF
jgi:hypothetical protein